MDLTEEEYVKKCGKNTWKNYTEKTLMTLTTMMVWSLNLPDILEFEVKWALGSITMNKASGGDGISAELLQVLKDDTVKVLYSLSRKFGKLSSGHRTGKGQFSFQS